MPGKDIALETADGSRFTGCLATPRWVGGEHFDQKGGDAATRRPAEFLKIHVA